MQWWRTWKLAKRFASMPASWHAGPGTRAGEFWLMAFDEEGIRDFLASGEGAPPPVFVGRETVLSDIERAGSHAWKGPDATRHGEPKATRIIQGAPGAGKSSILAELVKRSGERAGAHGQSRVVTVGSRQVVESPEEVIRMIGAAGGMPPERWRDVSGRLALGAEAMLGYAETELSWTAGSRPAPPHLSGLTERFPASRWRAPVIVAVDEAQRFRGDASTPHALFLQGIHDADTGLPLTLVLAGLGDTRERARTMELTRGLEIHEVGGLGENDRNDLMRRFCRHFGMAPGGHEVRLDALARQTEGWPRHLHFAMQALAGEALRHGGDLGHVDWDRIGTEAAESRVRYYRGQQSAEMAGSARLLATVMLALEPVMTLGDVRDLIWRLERNREESLQWRLPKGMDVDDFASHLVRQGAFQTQVDGTVACPIPSFRTHLVRAGGLDQDAATAKAEEESSADDSAIPDPPSPTPSFD